MRRFLIYFAILLTIAVSTLAVPTLPQPNVEFTRGSGQGGGVGSILYSDRTAAGGPMRIFVYDALGNTMALTDTGGTLTNVNAYEAFGSIILSSGTSINNRLAHSKERDSLLGLDNHGMRYYERTPAAISPAIRWTTPTG